MRKITYFLFAILAVIGFSRCTTLTDSDPNLANNTQTQGNIQTPGAFRAKINQTDWMAYEAFAIRTADSMDIYAYDKNGEEMLLHFMGTGTGTYILDYTRQNFGSYKGITQPAYVSNAITGLNNGKITINSLNSSTQSISGTFFFSAKSPSDPNVLEVTEGSFADLRYYSDVSQVPSGVAGLPLGFFKTDINGITWLCQALSADHYVDPTQSMDLVRISGLNNANSKGVGINIPYSTLAGSEITLPIANGAGIFYWEIGGNAYVTQDSFKVRINYHNRIMHRIEGYFSGVLYDTTNNVTLTNGRFNVKY